MELEAHCVRGTRPDARCRVVWRAPGAGGRAAGVCQAIMARAQRMFRDVIHPGCSEFCGRTNTGYPQPPQQTCADRKQDGAANGNWDAVCMSGVASWAVFLDDTTMLETVVDYFKSGTGNGRLINYILNEAGECQESGRDQGHTQLGLFNLVQAAFTVYHATNATEIFTMEGARLRAGLEYTAKYNLQLRPAGPSGTEGRRLVLSHHFGQRARGWAPMWEMVGAIYGAAAVPYTQELLRHPGLKIPIC
eukprot:900660-Prymnesium_polylepis.1